MRILVLGGCGFIGSHLVDACLLAGYTVSVIDRSKEKFRPPLNGVKYYYEDILSITNAYEAIQAADVIIHSVSSTNPASSNSDPEADVDSNLRGMLRLLACMQKYQKKRIIFLSSGGTVYGTPKQLPIPENHPLEPQCSYAVVKLAMEHYLNMFSKLHGFQTTILRAANPYGPRQCHTGSQGVIANFTAKAICNEPLNMWGTGHEVRDFFHINDLAKACMQCITSNLTGVYNVGSGHGYEIQEIIAILESIHNAPLQIKQLEKRSFDIPKIVLDIRAIQRDLGWSPEVPLQQGMSNYYHWLNNILSPSSK